MNHENIIDSCVLSVVKKELGAERQQVPSYHQHSHRTNKSIPQHIWGEDDDNEYLTEESSIDFSSLGDDDDDLPLSPLKQHQSTTNSARRRTKQCFSGLRCGGMLNDCSNADTISTANESCSWGESASASTSTSQLLLCDCHSHDEDEDDDSESSLTLEDLKAYFVEDQVGIFNPARADDLPPPKARTYYKGDSQNSFTLDDLVDMEAASETDEEDEDDTKNDEDSLGCLVAPSPSSRRRSSAARRRRSTRRRQSKRKSSKRHSLFLPEEEDKDLTTNTSLKGILKNGKCNTRRSSSLTMLMMEDSSMFRLSCGGFNDSSSSFNDLYNNNNNNNNKSKESDDSGGWGLLQQSFNLDEDEDLTCLDLQALMEANKQVSFSTVVVHSHPVVVGDNPSVSEGVPLMLDWTPQDSTTYESLEDYEDNKKQATSEEQHQGGGEQQQQTSCSPTTTSAVPHKLNAEERMFRLLNSGASLQDIQEAEALVNKTRQEREATRQSNLLGTTGHRTVFWKVLQKDVEESEEEEPELLLAPPPPSTASSRSRRN